MEIVYAHAGMGRELIDAAVRAGAQGLVIAGVGDGNFGSVALAAAAAAAQAGVVVVRSSRTGGGVVERNIEIDDDAAGFVAADELNPQKARVLLMLGLTRTRDPRVSNAEFRTKAKRCGVKNGHRIGKKRPRPAPNECSLRISRSSPRR